MPARRFSNRGFCPACDRAATFVAEGPWWRDQYICLNCGSVPRERALMYCIENFFPGWRKMTIHESSPVARGASLRLANECANYIPSQYFPDREPAAIHSGYRNENLEALTFQDASLDLHVTQDVFEHLLSPDLAFREIARTLKPGGAHIFTTPLINKTHATAWCARRLPDGTVQQIQQPPEYHKSAMSAEGSLVTVHWGYDITRYIYDACGLFTEMIYIDAMDLGIRAECIEVLITRKDA